MSENWTKGPWHVEVGTEDGDWGDIYVCHKGTVCPETTVVNFGDPTIEDAANAHLIAAAPELYDALELIYGRLLMSDRDGECRITAEDGEMAELALKKARGEL